MRELGETHTLSPQQVVSCDKVDDGCNGGNTESAYQYLENAGGLASESSYPYKSGVQERTRACIAADAADPVIAVQNFYTIKAGTNGKKGVESAMAKYVGSTGPLSICVDASAWQTYTGGVLKHCGTSIDHCVQAVGIDTGNGVWKVRNSWNTDWGEDGYIRLKYGVDACGLTNDATWTTVKDAVTPSPAPLVEAAAREHAEATDVIDEALKARPREVSALRAWIQRVAKRAPKSPMTFGAKRVPFEPLTFIEG